MNKKGNIHETRVNDHHDHSKTDGISIKGGEWLIKDQCCGEIFIPEEFSED